MVGSGLVTLCPVTGDEIRRVTVECIIPLLTGCCHRRRASRTACSGKPDDLFLAEYDKFDDYLEMVVQFGVREIQLSKEVSH